MAIVLRKGHRQAMDLAVALEVASLRLAQARRPEDHEQAMALNHRLWSAVRRLADRCSDVEERRSMLAAAADAEQSLAAGSPAVEQANRSLAMVLAGQFASTGALRELLHDWNVFRRSRLDTAVFETWLLERLGGSTVAMAA